MFSATLLAIALASASPFFGASLAQQEERPAFVIVERLATTGPESIQEEYARLARGDPAEIRRALHRPQPAQHDARG